MRAPKIAASSRRLVRCERTVEHCVETAKDTSTATAAVMLQDGTILASECQFTDEEISLLLSTMNANSFNFGAEVGTGLHQIAVQAKIYTSTSTQTGEAIATGTIGKGSMVVTEQRLAGR